MHHVLSVHVVAMRLDHAMCVVTLQVLVIALLTGLVQYPNPYTRFNASQVIRKLFSQCGPEDTGDLWSATCF